jgi:hypothetical protein
MDQGEQNIEINAQESLNALRGFNVSEEFLENAPKLEASVFGGDDSNIDLENSTDLDDDNSGALNGDDEGEDNGLNSDNNDSSSDDDLEDEIEHEIFGGKIKVNKPKNDSVEIENEEVIDSFLKGTGLDISAKDLSAKISEWKQVEEQLVETSTKLKNVDTLFSMLPPELYRAVDLVAKGQDWRPALSGQSKIDYSKDVSSFRDEDLVEAFLPGEISDDMWEEYRDEDGDPRLKKAVELVINQAKTKFVSTKEQKEELAKQEIDKQSKFIDTYASSMKNTISKLPEMIDGISDAYVKNIEKDLQSSDSIKNLFFDENGLMKESAAMAYVMAKDGLSLLDKYKRIIEKRVETEKNLEILNRGARSPKATSGKGGASGQGQEISAEAKREIEWIRSMAR